MRKAHIPKIGELQAFTACARLGTTTLAAEDLNLTQSAISRALASLEERLGVALFHRARQRLALAPAGHAFLPRAKAILAGLDEAAMSVMAFGGDSSVIRIATLPSFGRRWLMPRLAALTATTPGLSFDLQVRLERIDFTQDAIDLAIMRKTHEPAGARGEILLTEELITIAAPQLIGARDALTTQNMLGLQLQESMITVASQRGYQVKELRAGQAVEVFSDHERLLTRDLTDLATQQAVRYIIVGTLNQAEQYTTVNARMVDIQTNTVVAAASDLIPAEVLGATEQVQLRQQKLYRQSDN